MEIEGEEGGEKNTKQQRYKEMTSGTDESRESENKTGRLTAIIPIIASCHLFLSNKVKY